MKRYFTALHFVLLIFLANSTAFAADKTLLRCGKLVDVQAGRVLSQVDVLIEGGKVAQIGSGIVSDAEVIDLSDKTCLPGLIDMHVHFTHQSNPKSYMEPYVLNPADFAFRAVGFADITLRKGFTTVRSLGDRGDGTVSVSLRNAIDSGLLQGPRIFTAGKSIATTGGHADPTNGANKVLQGNPGPKQGVINSAEDAMQAVRQRYKDGADLIKITATGGVLSTAKNGQNPQFTEAELVAIITAAKDYGFKVAAHAHGAEGMKRAIRAGVSSIEHGTYMDDETHRLMKQYGTYLVPTIMAGEFVAEKAKIEGYFPEIVRPKAAAIGPLIQASFGKAYKAGVKIAFGTDTGVSAHGDNAQEFALMVEAGMPAMEAIKAATVNAADLLGASDSLGSIAVSKHADIIAVDGDPISNIRELENVTFVMKGGKVVEL
ncbi:MAG TPA: amidohydrolase [Gammaproteobacteria bacterium]|nr:amidohydrolase [Gammaproteobacteria bacterium]